MPALGLADTELLELSAHPLTLENIPALQKNVFPLSSHEYGLYKGHNTPEQVCFQSLSGRHTPFGAFHG